MTAIEPASDGEVERDPHDHSREYIPLPGGWEVQTKGAGSSYRLLDKKTGERYSVLSGKDWAPLQAFFTRFAHEVFAAARDERKALEARLTLAEETARAAVEAKDAAEFASRHEADLCAQALATIASLQSQVEAMRGALEPFARADRALGDRPGSDATFRLETDTGYREISREAFRRARSTLAAVEKETGE